MQLIDTHCHIHDSEFQDKFGKLPEVLLTESLEAGVESLVCVGTDARSSQEAVLLSRKSDRVHASVALHPHEAADKTIEELKSEFKSIEELVQTNKQDIVAIGECGLDYFYHNETDTREKQKEVFRWHIGLAVRNNLPLIFHIRDAFSDFFQIIDEFPKVDGVVHSFTAGAKEVDGIVKRGLYAGINGIITFTKEQYQLEAVKQIPLKNLVIETDAPFLTPNPIRGKVNEPKHVILITQFLSELRGESQALLAKTTTENAKALFKLNN